MTRTRTAGPGMLTDRYELTMLDAALRSGTAGHAAVFECFGRDLPEGRRYGVVAGLGRLLPLIEAFRFDPEEIDFLLATGAISESTADYLRTFRFCGDIEAYREGEIYGPYSPLLTVMGAFGEALLLETLLLSVLNHDSAIASAASRMRTAAGSRNLIEMGGRRTHEQAAVAAARAAYLAGFDSTSNLAAGYLYGIPTAGTSAHAFTLAHSSERAAFEAQVAAKGPGTSLLVDTYDIEAGIRLAVEVAGTALGAVRIDSGDLKDEAGKARLLLDSLGAFQTKIVITSDLDEYVIADLASQPVDGYGVGTRLVTGSGHPTAGLVYKLVAIADSPDPAAPLRTVEKTSPGKGNVGGRKVAYRTGDRGDVVQPRGDTPETVSGRPLQVLVMRAGRTVHAPTLAEIRAHAAAAKAELPPAALQLKAP